MFNHIKLFSLKKTIKYLLAFIGIISLINAHSQNAGNIAHGGSAGVYFITPFTPCSADQPNIDNAVKVQVERRKQGTDSWQMIGYFASPSSKKEFAANYRIFYKFALAPEFTNPDNLSQAWDKYTKYKNWDSLRYLLYDRIIGLALGKEYLDTTAVVNTVYEYRVSEITKDGTAINPKISNPVSAPDLSVFKSAPKSGKVEQSLTEISIDWKVKTDKRIRMYKVFRKHQPMDNFEFIMNSTDLLKDGKSDSTILKMRDLSVAENQAYSYYVIAYDAYGNFSKASDTMYTKTYEMKDVLLPQYFIAKSISAAKAIQLNWKLVSDQSVSAIEIYRSNDYEGTYENIGKAVSSDTSFTDFGVDPSKVYYYYLQMIDRFQHKTLKSARTYGLQEDLNPPAPPRFVKAENEANQTKISWTTSEKNIRGYYVFRSLGLDTNFLLISDFIPHKDSVTSYSDKTLNLNSPYGYSYAVKQENTSHIQSRFSLPAYLTTKMKADSIHPVYKPEVQGINGKAMLFWDNMQNMQGVTSYNVLRRKKGEKEFNKVNKTFIPVSYNFYNDTTVKNGNIYEYSIETVVVSGEKSKPSEPVEFSLSYPPPSPPNGIELYKTKEGVLISWLSENVSPVKEYQVYRTERGSEKEERITSVPNSVSSYTDTRIQTGKSYFYHVVAVGVENENSDASEAKFISIN